MANPARIPDPRSDDPLDPAATSRLDPVTGEPRTSAKFDEPRVVNRVETRSGGSGIMIAGVVLVLAVIAYFVFAPASDDAVAPEPATTADPATPAPEAVEPAPPAADTTAPAPEAVAPEAPAAPETTAPEAVAPEAPAEPAPAEPAPAEPAPAQ